MSSGKWITIALWPLWINTSFHVDPHRENKSLHGTRSQCKSFLMYTHFISLRLFLILAANQHVYIHTHCVATVQGQTGPHRIRTDGRIFMEPSGCLTCLYSAARQSTHAASCMSHQQGVPTPSYTKCTQSWQGAKILYNKAWFYTWGSTQGYGNSAYQVHSQGCGKCFPQLPRHPGEGAWLTTISLQRGILKRRFWESYS